MDARISGRRAHTLNELPYDADILHVQLLSECLSLVPLAGPTCVALPVDPLEILSQRWGLSKLDLFEERWKVEDPDVLLYLRRNFPTGRGPSMAEQQWRDSIDG